jgi:hypothetical protein
MAGILVRRDWVAAGIGAGLTASVTLAAFAALSQWSAGYPIDGTYTYLAGKLAGPGADGAPWAVPAGIATLVVGSIGWALAYVYAAQKQPQLFTRPWVSGIVFGAIVWLVMNAVQIPVGELHPLSIFDEDRNVFALALFFGVPIALVSARLTRAR